MFARILLAALAALPCLTSGANLGSDSNNIPVGVILKFGNRSWSPAALRIMQTEAASLLRKSGVDLLWSIYGQPQQQIDFGQLVVFRMSGKCAMDSFPLVPDELGLPLART